MDEAALTELVASIRDHGLLQPITVRRTPGGRFQVIAGHRRVEAFRRLFGESDGAGGDASERFSSISAHEKFDVTDEEMALFALVENLQRDDLSPLDAALGLSRFQEMHQLSTETLCKRTGLEIDRAKRLLRLSRSPKIIQDACHQGLLVDKVDQHGELALLPSGKPRQERNRLDLMAALEFSKLHAQVAKASPKKADERVARAIERALAERWSFRRIQAYCRDVANGSQPTTRETSAKGTGPLPLFSDGAELRVRRDRLPSATQEERSALAEVLKAMLGELAA